MASWENVKKLLRPDKNLPLKSDGTYPAYNEMLNNARNSAIQNSIPESLKNIADGAETNTNKSEPNILDKVITDPEARSNTHALSDLYSIKKPEEADYIDRRKINAEIINSYLKDANPSVLYNSEHRSTNNNYKQNRAEHLDTQKALLNEAKKLLPYETSQHVNIRQVPPDNTKAGEYDFDDKQIRIPYTNDVRNSTPFHEYLHAVNDQQGIDPNNIESEKLNNFKESNYPTISRGIIDDQNAHIKGLAPGLISPTDTPEYNMDSPGESGYYFKNLMRLLGKEIK